MKKYLKEIIILLGIVLLFFITRYTFYKKDKEKINIEEEVTPVWIEDKIESFEYEIIIEKNLNEKELLLSTHILDSISHYKDINSLENITVYITINNQSNNNYQIKNILLVDESNVTIKKISYTKDNNKIIFQVDKSFFTPYLSIVQLQLKNM